MIPLLEYPTTATLLLNPRVCGFSQSGGIVAFGKGASKPALSSVLKKVGDDDMIISTGGASASVNNRKDGVVRR
jgi:hypothetical protein